MVKNRGITMKITVKDVWIMSLMYIVLSSVEALFGIISYRDFSTQSFIITAGCMLLSIAETKEDQYE